jgi:telomere-associated protein RIF1
MYFFKRPILRQAKQKILLLLPGLENVEMMDESSEPYSESVSFLFFNLNLSSLQQ